MVNIQFSIAGQQQLDRTLNVLETKPRDFRPVWEAIKNDIIVGEMQQLASEGTTGSGGWAPLSPKYKAWKDKHYPGKRILQRTGALWSSLTNPSDENFVYTGSARSLTFTSLLEYAMYHQTGTPRMPARPPVELTEKQRQGIMKALQAHLFSTQGRPIRTGHPAGIRLPSWGRIE